MVKPVKFWDRLATQFDKQTKRFEDSNSKTLTYTKKYLKASDIVLDYGCATGQVAIDISDNVTEVHGIDISSKMIDLAKAKSSERGIKNVNFTQALIFDEQLQKETFDVVLAFNILHFFEDPGAVIQRINELLKPGGLFISATTCMGEKNSAINALLWLLVKLRLVPYMRHLKNAELDHLISEKNFLVIGIEDYSTHFVAARKI